MFNVLPDIFKNDIRKNYSFRRWVVVCLCIVGIQISLLIFALPSIVVSHYKEKELQLDVDAFHSLRIASRSNAPLDIIPRTNNMLHILDTTLEYPRVVPIVETILAQKNTGIRLTSFAYVFSDATHATVSIQGYSASRESLVSFVKSLRESTLFASVDSPVSNLAKEKNIDFVITVSVEKRHE